MFQRSEFKENENCESSISLTWLIHFDLDSDLETFSLNIWYILLAVVISMSLLFLLNLALNKGMMMTCKFHCGDCEPMEKTETIPCYLCDKNVNKVNNLINWLWCQFGNKTRDFYWRLNGKTVLIGKAVRTKKRPSWIECQGLWKSTVQIAFRCAHWDKNAFLVKKMPICSKKEKNAEIRFFWGWKFKFVFKGEKGISHQCAAMFLQLYVEEREKYHPDF